MCSPTQTFPLAFQRDTDKCYVLIKPFVDKEHLSDYQEKESVSQ